MEASTITRKGQVTIAKPIRERLRLRKGEKVLFVMRGEDVVLKVVRGTILELRGTVKPSARPEDFAAIRKSVRRAVAARATRHGLSLRRHERLSPLLDERRSREGPPSAGAVSIGNRR